MTVIARLETQIRLSSDRLRTDMRRVNSQFNRFTGGLRQSFGRFGTFASSALGTELLTGLVRTARRSFETADSFAKLSRSVGLSAEEFQRLTHAFELAGSGQRTLVTAFTTLAQRIGDGRDELQSYLRQFDTLNIAISDLEGLTLKEQFDLITDAIRGMNDETEKINVTAKIFGGRAAKELGTILQSSRADIDAAGDALERLGAVLNSDQLSRIENINDQFTILGRVVSTNYTRALADAIPEGVSFASIAQEIGRVIYDLTRGFIEVGRFIYEHRQAIGYAIAAWVTFRTVALAGAVISGFKALALAIAALSKTLFALVINPVFLAALAAVAVIGSIAAVVFGDISSASIDLIQSFKDTGIGIVNFVKASGTAISELASIFVYGFTYIRAKIIELIVGGLATVLRSVDDYLTRTADKINLVFGTNIVIPQFLDDFTSQFEQSYEVVDNVTGLLEERINESKDALGDAFGDIGDSISEVGEGLGSVGTGIKDAFLTGVEGAKDAIADLLGFADPSNLIQDATQNIDLGNIQRNVLGDFELELEEPEITGPAQLTRNEQLGQDLVGNLRSSLSDGIRAGDFSEVARSLETNLASTLSDFAAQGLTDLFGGLLGRIFQGTGFGGFINTAFGGEFHSGGVVPGVRGQERLILAQAGETVFTPDQLSDLVQGGGQTTVNVNGVDQSSIERVVRRMAQQGVFSRNNVAYARERLG